MWCSSDHDEDAGHVSNSLHETSVDLTVHQVGALAAMTGGKPLVLALGEGRVKVGSAVPYAPKTDIIFSLSC